MDRITEQSGSHSQPVSSGKMTDLAYEIAVGARCARCKLCEEDCKCPKRK